MIQVLKEGDLKSPVIRFNCLRCKCVFLTQIRMTTN